VSAIERLRGWVDGEQLPVVVVAVALAIPTLYLVPWLLDGPPSLGFFAMLTVGVGVPRVYERWPWHYGPGLAAAWTVGAAVFLLGELGVLFLVLAPLVGGFWAGAVAFVVADLGTMTVLSAAGVPDQAAGPGAEGER
jgi:hypothetical protein